TEQHQVQVRGAGRVPGPGQLQERAEAGELVRDRRRVVGRLGGAGQPDGDRRPVRGEGELAGGRRGGDERAVPDLLRRAGQVARQQPPRERVVGEGRGEDVDRGRRGRRAGQHAYTVDLATIRQRKSQCTSCAH